VVVELDGALVSTDLVALVVVSAEPVEVGVLERSVTGVSKTEGVLGVVVEEPELVVVLLELSLDAAGLDDVPVLVELAFVELSTFVPVVAVPVGAVTLSVFFDSRSPLVVPVLAESVLGLSQPDAGLSVDFKRSPSATGGSSFFDFLDLLDFLEGLSDSASAAGFATSWCSAHISSSEPSPICARAARGDSVRVEANSSAHALEARPLPTCENCFTDLPILFRQPVSYHIAKPN